MTTGENDQLAITLMEIESLAEDRLAFKIFEHFGDYSVTVDPRGIPLALVCESLRVDVLEAEDAVKHLFEDGSSIIVDALGWRCRGVPRQPAPQVRKWTRWRPPGASS